MRQLTSPEPCDVEISRKTTGEPGPSIVHQVGYTKIRDVAMAQRDVAMAQRDAVIDSSIWKMFAPYRAVRGFILYQIRKSG